MSDRRELILYATPRGKLADQCRRYQQCLERESAATVAQGYPPHITLTGFFQRRPTRADEVIAEMGRDIAAAGPVPEQAVTVDSLVTEPQWVGLAITSPWLEALTVDIIAGHRLEPGDDALRPKSRLHLSLAYGQDSPLEHHARLALSMITPVGSGWRVAVWERAKPEGDGSATWHRF